jgi:uncharacterized protein YdhG (YjbR/CyaY superfamily)
MTAYLATGHSTFSANRLPGFIERDEPLARYARATVPSLEPRNTRGKGGIEVIVMKNRRLAPRNIDEYIASFSPEVQSILEKIRATIRKAAPAAEEKISYQIPTFALKGNLVHFAAFKQHIGFYPPVKGDEKLQAEIAPYRGEKGNLRFPLDEPIPYALIRRLVKIRVQEQMEKVESKRRK